MSDIKDQLESMIAGTHEDVEIEEVEEEIEEEESVDEVVEETTDTVDAEDTDQEDESVDEEDTEEDADEDVQETSEEAEEDEEEDAHAEPEETEVEQTEDKVEDETEESEEEADDAESEDKEEEPEIDYKKFYEEVALAKFTANGREVDGFTDPKDLIRAQQMLHGYSDKMKVFKEYKKFLKPLEERKITQDPGKFNLAMNLLDGNMDAIKSVLKEKGIDPLEMDLEDIDYTPINTLPSDAQMLIEEVSAQAKELGVEEKFHKALTKDFDDESLQEFINVGEVRTDLIRHLKDGTYDKVQNEITRMELLDTDGKLDSVNSVNKYRMAINRLATAEKARTEKALVAKPAEPKKVVPKGPTAKEIADAAEFKKKAAAKEKAAAEARKKAASISKKRVVKQKPKEVKMESLSGDDFRASFRDMMMS